MADSSDSSVAQGGAAADTAGGEKNVSSSSNQLLCGYGLLTFAVLLLSIDALLILEVSDLGDWTIIFYRYWLMGITIATYFFVSELDNAMVCVVCVCVVCVCVCVMYIWADFTLCDIWSTSVA